MGRNRQVANAGAPKQLKRWVAWGGMGPGAPGFARAYPIAYTGKLSLAHATRPITYFGALVIRAAEGWYSARLGDNIRIVKNMPRTDGKKRPLRRRSVGHVS